MKKYSFLILLLAVVLSSCKKDISGIRVPDQPVKLYEPLFLDFNLALDFKDPFDADSITVDMVITEQDGDTLRLPCFYKDGVSGNSTWSARFTPMSTGDHSFYIEGKTVDLSVKSEVNVFSVDPSDKKGFIRLNPDSYYTFLFDSGEPFRGIGENFGWESRTGGEDELTYDKMFALFKENGLNVTRTWMCPWNMPLEWTKLINDTTYVGAYDKDSSGYDQKAIDKMDYMIEQAEKNDVYVFLVFDYHGALITEADYWGGNNMWTQHDYYVGNGGPAETPADFFTNEEARRMYKNRLRYLIARWGYSPNILAWEFWNEVDIVKNRENVPPEAISDWHEEMSEYLEKNDPYDHLVTTSLAGGQVQGLFHVSGLDLSQTHPYRHTAVIPDIVDSMTNLYNKPYIVGEFAYDWKAITDETWPLYVNDMQDGMWRGIFSRNPVLPMTWWWDYYHRDDLYPIFKSVADFSTMMLEQPPFHFEEVQVMLPAGMEGYALKHQSNTYYGWVGKKEGIGKPELVTVSEVENGNFWLKIYDTVGGSVTIESEIEVRDRTAKIDLGIMQPESDIAFILGKN